MRKITFTLLALVAAFAVNAQQTVILDQAPKNSGIVSAMYEENGAQIIADDFTMSTDMKLMDLSFYGFSVLDESISQGLLDGTMTHFNLFIIPADASGMPVDLMDESVLHLELPVTDDALDIDADGPHPRDDGGNEWGYTFTVDVEAFLGVDDATLPAGTYWAAPAPFLDADFDADPTEYMWYWLNTEPFTAQGEQAVYYAGESGWVNLNEAAGSANYAGMAMTITGEQNMGVEDHDLASFTHFTQNGQLFLESAAQIEGVAIYNLLGQQVINTNINATSGSIDLGSLSSGIYVTKVNVNGQTKAFKFSVK